MRTRWGIAAASAAGAIAIAGCTATRPPTELIAKTEYAVEEARDSDADEHAALELRLAQDKLAAAKRAVDEEEHERARWLVAEALVDAELAEAKAESEVARTRARDLRQGIEALEAETDRAISDVTTGGTTR